LVSFDCFDPQLSNVTKTIRIGFVLPEESSNYCITSSLFSSLHFFHVM
jgi:hypothetical protein